MSKLKAGLNKIIVQAKEVEYKSKVLLPDHLKEKTYVVINVGPAKTTFECNPTFVKAGDVVHLAPNSGFVIKVNLEEFIVCTADDILAIA